MELVLQCTAAAIFSALTSILLKRYHPELSFSLSALTLALILLSCLRLLSNAGELLRSVRGALNVSADQLQPVLKCLGIAAVSRFGAGLCRDASQSALASFVYLPRGLLPLRSLDTFASTASTFSPTVATPALMLSISPVPLKLREATSLLAVSLTVTNKEPGVAPSASYAVSEVARTCPELYI